MDKSPEVTKTETGKYTTFHTGSSDKPDKSKEQVKEWIKGFLKSRESHVYESDEAPQICPEKSVHIDVADEIFGIHNAEKTCYALYEMWIEDGLVSIENDIVKWSGSSE